MQGNFLGLPTSVWSVIIPVTVLLLAVVGWGYWASLAFDKEKTGKYSSLVAQWRRPSTMLLVLLFGYTIYTRSIARWEEIAVLVFVVLRYWERDAFAVGDLRQSDVDKTRDELVADSKPKEKHWDDE